MSKYKYKIFEEIVAEIFENGNLKKGYNLVLTNICNSCIRSSITTFSFILDFIEIENKRYMFSEENNLEIEIIRLYSDLKDSLSEEDEKIREERLLLSHDTGIYEGSVLTLFYYNEKILDEKLDGLYRLKLLDEKLLPYRKNCNYIARNSADISYIYKNAFNSMGKLEKDYEFTIEYGMKTKKGVSIFSVNILTSNSDAPYGCISKLIDRAERLLRLQERVYTKQENSLLYLIMGLKYKDKIMFKKEFSTFNNHEVRPIPYSHSEKYKKRTSSIGNIVASIIQDVVV